MENEQNESNTQCESESNFIEFDFSGFFTNASSNAAEKNKIHKLFMYLKSTNLKIKNQRRYHFDSLLKKTKVKVFRMVHECIRKCLRPQYKLKRLPQTFITNIKIEFNSKILDRTVASFYSQFEIFELCSEVFSKSGGKVNNILEHSLEEKKHVLKEFLSLNFEQVCEYYLTSSQYLKDRQRTVKVDGHFVETLFAFIAQSFILYYSRK